MEALALVPAVADSTQHRPSFLMGGSAESDPEGAGALETHSQLWDLARQLSVQAAAAALGDDGFNFLSSLTHGNAAPSESAEEPLIAATSAPATSPAASPPMGSAPAAASGFHFLDDQPSSVPPALVSSAPILHEYSCALLWNTSGPMVRRTSRLQSPAMHPSDALWIRLSPLRGSFSSTDRRLLEAGHGALTACLHYDRFHVHLHPSFRFTKNVIYAVLQPQDLPQQEWSVAKYHQLSNLCVLFSASQPLIPTWTCVCLALIRLCCSGVRFEFFLTHDTRRAPNRWGRHLIPPLAEPLQWMAKYSLPPGPRLQSASGSSVVDTNQPYMCRAREYERRGGFRAEYGGEARPRGSWRGGRNRSASSAARDDGAASAAGGREEREAFANPRAVSSDTHPPGSLAPLSLQRRGSKRLRERKEDESKE
jgi:hypothetical protein